MIPIACRSHAVVGDHRRLIGQRDNAARRRCCRRRDSRRGGRVDRVAVQRRRRGRRHCGQIISGGAVLESAQRRQIIPHLSDALRVAVGQHAAAAAAGGNDAGRHQGRCGRENGGAQIRRSTAAFWNPRGAARLRSAAIEARSRWIWRVTWRSSSDVTFCKSSDVRTRTDNGMRDLYK